VLSREGGRGGQSVRGGAHGPASHSGDNVGAPQAAHACKGLACSCLSQRRSSKAQLDFWTSGLLDFWTSGLLDLWTFGLVDFWTSGLLDFWTSGLLDFSTCVRYCGACMTSACLLCGPRIVMLLSSCYCDWVTWLRGCGGFMVRVRYLWCVCAISMSAT